MKGITIMRKVVEIKADNFEEAMEGLADIFKEITEDIEKNSSESEEEKKISVEFEPDEDDEDDCEEENCCECCEKDDDDGDNEWFVIPGKVLHQICDMVDIARFSEDNDEFIRNASELVGAMAMLHVQVIPEKRFYELKQLIDTVDKCAEALGK